MPASLSSPSASPTPDPCLVATSATSPIAYDTVRACLDADFPFPADNRVKTAESIKKLLRNSYVFEDLAENPPAVSGLTLNAAPIAQDIDALLGMNASMNANAVQTHREFHEAISNSMIKARDAHLSYSADCFLQFTFDHGFTMAEWVDETGTRSLNVLNTWADNNLDISKDAAVRYNYAMGGPTFVPNQSGYSTSGPFSRRKSLPAEPSLTFGFSCPHLWGAGTVNQVVVRWGASYKGSPLTISQYSNTYCVSKTPALTTTTTTNQENTLESLEEQEQYGQQQQQEQPEDPFDYLPESMQDAINKTVEEFKALPDWLAKETQEVILGPAAEDEPEFEWTGETNKEVLRAQAERMLQEMPAFESVPKIPIFERPDVYRTLFDDRFTASTENYRVLINSPLGVHAILLGDNKTGVILIPTFNPPGGSTVLAQFYANLIAAITALRPMAERLILDLSRNGGGSTCLSRRSLELFFPETPQVVTNIRYSDLEALYIQTNTTAPSNYNRATDGSLADNAYLTTTVSHPNRKFNFSNYFVETCAKFQYDKLPVDPKEESLRPRAVKNSYNAEDIIIFSEGTCGSACATFANQMNQKNNVKAVVAGYGPTTDKISFSTFPGGQVYKAEEAYFEMYRWLKKTFQIQALSDSTDIFAMQDKDTVTNQPSLEKSQDDTLLHALASFSPSQGAEIVRLLPEPLQHSANLTVTWRQTYNTGNVKVLFTRNSAGELVPNWPLATWTEYSFIPADFRIPYTLNSFMNYHTLWEAARDAAWSN
ncbi:hypothetical protein BGZ81_004018 [Podila clonocystis]|nr:hypothetical protein BGZ81_004018 [Podila clonocystis]